MPFKFKRLFILSRRMMRNEMLYLSILAIGIGVLSGYAALLLRFSIEWVAHLWTGEVAWDRAMQTLPWYIYLLAPTVAGLIIGWINVRLLASGELRGVAGVLADLVERNSRINRKQLVTETVGGAISIGSGASLGREGPTVALGAAIASEVAHRIHLTEQQARILIGCGVASGMAASFNTPIAGVLFALEVILADYAVATFGPIVISSVVATVITRAELGNFPAFIIPEYHLISAWEIPSYVGVGVFCGLIAALLIRSMAPLRQYLMLLVPNRRLLPALAGFFVGLLGLIIPHVMSIGYGTLGSILMEQVDPVILGVTLSMTAFLAIVLLGKLLAVSVCFAAGFPGGLLGPSLFLGAVAGGLCGGIIHSISPAFTESSGAYALVACGALTAAALQAPLTIMLMVFELSADYHIMLPLMAATIVATLVKRAFGTESVFTEVLEERGIDTGWGREQSWLRAFKLKRIRLQSMPVVPENAPLAEVKKVYTRSGKACVQVIDVDELMIGMITFTDLQPWLQDAAMDQVAIAGEIMNKKVGTLSEDASLLEAIHLFDREIFEQIPVVAKDNPRKVLGLLPRHAVFSKYHQLIVKHGEQQQHRA